MQRKFIAAAVFASFPLIASAQSSVTIYGIADAAIAREDTGAPNGRRTAIASGNQSGSRIGFRGVEDLGNGLKATFNIEAAVALDTGAGNTNLFDRRAVVGLQGAFGTVNVGRDYTPVADVALLTDINGQGLYGTNLSAFGTLRMTRRISNSVNFKTNSLSGFRLGLAYGAGEQTAGPSQNLKGISADYTNGPFYVGTAYQTTERLASRDDREFIIGAGVKFGAVEIRTNYIQADPTLANEFEQINLGGSYTLAANKFFLNFQQNELENGAKGRTWSVGYTYAMSKRTNLYAAYAALRNNHNANFGIFSGANNVTPAAAFAGADPKALTLGVRHYF